MKYSGQEQRSLPCCHIDVAREGVWPGLRRWRVGKIDVHTSCSWDAAAGAQEAGKGGSTVHVSQGTTKLFRDFMVQNGLGPELTVLRASEKYKAGAPAYTWPCSKRHETSWAVAQMKSMWAFKVLAFR